MARIKFKSTNPTETSPKMSIRNNKKDRSIKNFKKIIAFSVAINIILGIVAFLTT